MTTVRRFIGGTFVSYNPDLLIKDKYGIRTGIGEVDNDGYVWLAYYPDDKAWEIERFLRSANDWADFYEAIKRKL
ncbi:hypothetical protein SDC9_46821 [bioreactor metagenome]|uniref:Uncharacterized protein n=1 Tax=bioreactor metagenome TaxID=1076179 RepID=A0A644WE40_9ZZZZ